MSCRQARIDPNCTSSRETLFGVLLASVDGDVVVENEIAGLNVDPVVVGSSIYDLSENATAIFHG
jgi:hypothetical protein